MHANTDLLSTAFTVKVWTSKLPLCHFVSRLVHCPIRDVLKIVTKSAKHRALIKRDLMMSNRIYDGVEAETRQSQASFQSI